MQSPSADQNQAITDTGSRQSPSLLRTAILPSNPLLYETGISLIERAATIPLNLIPLRSKETVESLQSQMGTGPLCVCDFPIEGVEKWERVLGGFRHPTLPILNIDHHARHTDMYRHISSGNLAAEYVRIFGPTGMKIINSHLDCDSVISRLIMGGEIPPLPLFEDAVIAADHTGAAQPVADLLQALDQARDFNLSVRNLGLLLSGQDLDPQAVSLLERRHENRLATEAFVNSGNVEVHGRLAVLRFDGEMRNEFLPALLPDIAVFLTIEPGKGEKEVMRLRLGQGVQPGFTLYDLNMSSFDPGYGGRWNAGSNKRGGGSPHPLADYVSYIATNLAL